MEPKTLEDRDKLKGLARGLVDSFLITAKMNSFSVISLHGAEESVLDYVSNEMRKYLVEIKKDDVQVIRGNNQSDHPIDIGYYFNGNGKIVG